LPVNSRTIGSAIPWSQIRRAPRFGPVVDLTADHAVLDAPSHIEVITTDEWNEQKELTALSFALWLRKTSWVKSASLLACYSSHAKNRVD